MNSEYSQPHCSNFSIDRSTVIALGGSQQIVPPAEIPHLQTPQWNPSPVEHQLPDSDKAGEEFLRCIAANKPLPDYLKGNMAYNLADAFKSATVLKEAIKVDPKFKKQLARSKSRSRSRSRGRSCGRSRAKSRGRSKSRARSKSRGRSRGRSKSRGRSRSRSRSKGNKSRAHRKNLARSRNRTRSKSRSPSRSKKSRVRSKSQVRRSKSRSSSSENSHGKDKKRIPTGNSNNLPRNTLLEELKLVMNSKDMEARLPSLKEAILTIQGSNEDKEVACKDTSEKHDKRDDSVSLENDSMLLPHERVGGDFSWLQEKSLEDILAQKANELEDEESFLYGTESYSQVEGLANLAALDSSDAGSHQNSPPFSSLGNLFNQKQSLLNVSSGFASSSLSSAECEKVKNILKTLGASSDPDMMKTQGPTVENDLYSAPVSSGTAVASLNNPNVRKALESLQCLIKATKEERAKVDGSHQMSARQKADEDEDRKRERQAIVSEMETLAQKVEELFNQDGHSFLSPVIGFYCQKCQEFIGDLKSVDMHTVAYHSTEQSNKLRKDGKGHSQHHSSTGGRNSSERSNHKNGSEFQQKLRDEQGQRNPHHSDDPRGHGASQENVFLKEEMKTERMLITVSRGRTPPNIKIKEEVDKEQPIKGHGKTKVERTNKMSKTSRGKDKDRSQSSDSSVDSRSPKTKHSKKKKKKEKKKKKKKDKL